MTNYAPYNGDLTMFPVVLREKLTKYGTKLSIMICNVNFGIGSKYSAWA